MSHQKIDQKEYLKKYLSGGSSHTKKKKKKKEKPASNVRVNIVDDDIDLSQLANATEEDLDNYNLGEDLPQIAGIVDERPADLIAKEDYKTSGKWKSLENEDNEIANISKKPEAQRSDEYSFDMKSKRIRNRSPTRSNRSPDASPPRRSNRSRESSPRRRKSPPKRSDRSPDASPPRRRSRDSPPRRRKSPPRRSDRSPDASPPRKSNRSRDPSPRRRKSPPKHSDRSPDASPPRKSNRSPDSSPRRKKSTRTRWDRSPKTSPPRRSDQDRDASPRRRKSPAKLSNRSPDASPPRRSNRSRDSSPRRKRSPPRRSDRSPDASPPRRSNRSRDSSPRRRRSPPKRSDRSPDASPPRRSNRSPDSRHSERQSMTKRKMSDSPPPTHKKMTKTLEGKIAGLQDAKALREENDEFKRREDEMYRKMEERRKNNDDGTVIGDRKTGRRRHLREDVEKDREKQKKHEERKKVYDRWGKGLKQLEEYKERVETESHEMSKPVARYANDEDLEDYLKNQYREGDPMAAYMRKKDKESQKGPSKPTYQGAFPENRFGIRPGYRWDGVDRSNGYEKKWFDNLSQKKAGEEEAYKYSVEDM